MLVFSQIQFKKRRYFLTLHVGKSLFIKLYTFVLGLATFAHFRGHRREKNEWEWYFISSFECQLTLAFCLLVGRHMRPVWFRMREALFIVPRVQLAVWLVRCHLFCLYLKHVRCIFCLWRRQALLGPLFGLITCNAEPIFVNRFTILTISFASAF